MAILSTMTTLIRLPAFPREADRARPLADADRLILGHVVALRRVAAGFDTRLLTQLRAIDAAGEAAPVGAMMSTATAQAMRRFVLRFPLRFPPHVVSAAGDMHSTYREREGAHGHGGRWCTARVPLTQFIAGVTG